MNISSPYRFVPLSPLLLLPDWAEAVSHDHPFIDGVCGDLQLTLHCHTPLCVGGEQTNSSEHAPGKVHFSRTVDEQLAIPGTSLKGMLRNVLEIASFARFKQVEDQRLGVRDISESKNFYTTAITKVAAKAGWLRFVEGSWFITPCDYSRLHQQALIDWCKLTLAAWTSNDNKTAAKRYQLINLLPKVRFDTQPHANKGQLAIPDHNGPLHGHIVVTGQPGPSFNQGQKSKKYEFVFHAPKPDATPVAPVPVDATVMRGFQHIHEKSDEWKFWQEKLNTGKLAQGIPVFFHGDNNTVSSLGLALMYKLPYAHSVHQAISHTHPAHLAAGAPDLPELLFGRIDESNSDSLRGRIAIGPGELQDPVSTLWQGPTVLSSPKPTFYPAYVRQDNDREFRQLMEKDSQLSGWKRYPARPADVLPPPDKSGYKSQITLESVPQGTRFRFTLRVHNLRQVELGALLWALDFGGRSGHRHGLGLAKAYGMGQVSLQLEQWDLQPNDPAQDSQAVDALWLQACRREFTGLMEQFFSRAQAGSWISSGPIKALLDYALPARTADELEYLPTPKDYQAMKKSAELAEIRRVLHGFSPALPASPFDVNQLQSFTANLAGRLQEAQHEEQVAEAKRQRQHEAAQATPQHRALMELEDEIKRLHADGPSKTLLGNINEQIRRLHEHLESFIDGDRARLVALVETCQQIDDKKIQKACKKITQETRGGIK